MTALRRATPRTDCQGFNALKTCILLSSAPIAASIIAVSGNKIMLETSDDAPIGARVEILHAEAGKIAAQIVDRSMGMVSLALNAGDAATRTTLAMLSRSSGLA